MNSVTARWTARLTIRKRLLAAARYRYVHQPTKGRLAKLDHRKYQVAYAERVIERHRVPPLRERAWAEMQKLIDAKVTEVGANNHGKLVEAIIRFNGGVPGEPWCGDTVAWCYLKAGATSVVRAWASVSWLERLLTRVRRPKRGHVVTYTFSHTGLFSHWQLKGSTFWAGEGNTGNTGAQSDSVTGGDGVKLKLRSVHDVVGFYRVRA